MHIMRIIKSIVLLLVVGLIATLLVIPSCKHDLVYCPLIKPVDTSHHVIVDTTHCDTCAAGVISFTEDVLPILVSNCAKTGCHDATTQANGLITTNYQLLMSTSDISGNPLGSNFWNSMSGGGDNAMPPAGPLTAPQLAIIQQWLQQGAPNTACSHYCGCDSVHVTFAQNIYPVIQNYCLGCHTTGSALGNTDLTGYSKVLVQVTNGKLMKTIQHQTGPGIVAMPYGSAQLSACTIAKFQTWVNGGAPNN
jgi:hypothetical protein